MIKLVVFDMAGTTVLDRDDVHHALMSALKAFGFEVTREEANDVMGYPKPYAIRELLNLHGETPTVEYIAEIHQHFLDEMIHFYETDPGVAPTLHAEETFVALRAKGIKVGLDTGFSQDITEAIIKRLGWVDKIDAWVASDMVRRGRPYPDMIQYLMDKTGVSDMGEVAKVGDTLSDLKEGKNADCKYVIGVTTGAYSAEVLATEYHTHLVDDLMQVVDIVTAES